MKCARNWHKKALGLICFMFCCIIWFSSQTTVSADTINKSITSNDTTKSVVKDNTHIYKFKISKTGYFTFDLRAADITNNAEWYVELLDKSGNSMLSQYGHCYTSPKISVAAGQYFYLKISNNYDARDAKYVLTLKNVADSKWEREYNNTQAKATKLASNKTLSGMLTSDDEDWYCYTMPKDPGYVTFTLKQKDIAETGDFKLEVKDSAGNTLWYDYGTSMTTCRFPYKSGQKLYLIVTNSYGATWDVYNISSKFNKTDAFEKENNNSSANATGIKLGKQYYGLIGPESDSEDWYRFKISDIKKMKIEFGPQDISNTGTWRVELYDKNNNSTEMIYSDKKEIYTGYLKKGTYYIRVTNSYSTSGKLYAFKVSASNVKITDPKIKSAKVTSRSWTGSSIFGKVTLSTKSANASGYVVYTYMSKDKTGKAETDITGNVKVLDFSSYAGYNSKKYTYIQVSSYINDVFGNKIYTGKKTPLKKIKLPK